jgi:type IV pilus assembly protein PilM
MFRSKVRLTPVAVDPGSHELRVLQLAVGDGGCRVLAAASQALPAELRRADERREALGDALTELLRRCGFKGRDILAVVPRAAMRFKSFRLPHMPEEELREVARFEAQERFALEDPDAQYRFLLAGEVRQGQDLRQEVIAMACPAETLNGLLALFDRHRLRCAALDVGPCCVVRALEWPGETAGGASRVYADFGHHSTHLIVTREGRILFIKSIDVGGARLSERTARTPGSTAAQAAEPHGRQAADGDDCAAAGGESAEPGPAPIQPAVEQLGREIGMCMRYYSVTFRAPRCEEVICVGGPSHDQGLLDALADCTGMRFMRGAPLRYLETSGVFSGAQRSSQLGEWATAVGLALRGVGQPSAAGVPA